MMRRQAAGPPALASALLARLLPAEEAEVIGGDLDEMFHSQIVPVAGLAAARRWYWRQVASVLVARLTRSRDDSPEPLRQRMRIMPTRQDLRFALRSLVRQPAFAVTAIVLLALGIGANVAMFALVNAVLLKPLPFTDPDRLMLVHLLRAEEAQPAAGATTIWSYPKYQVFREHQRAFASTAAYGAFNWNITGSETPERVAGELVEAAYFAVLEVAAQAGRTFTADETAHPGSAPLAILGDGLWKSRFGADPAIVGRTIGLNGTPHTIVGVAPRGFRGLTGQSAIFVPITTLSADDLGEKWNHSYMVVARRRDDVTAGQAAAEARAAGAIVHKQIGNPPPGGAPWSATAVPLDGERVEPVIRRSVLLMLAAVGAVLLIVCINLASLVLARGLARQRDIGIRLALGASRLRIVRELMTESVLLALGGALGGIVIAYLCLSTGAAMMPDLGVVLSRGHESGLTRVGLSRLGVDLNTLLFTAGAAAAAALLFGLVPAWRTARGNVSATIKTGSAGALGARRYAGRTVLMVAEVALALVLLTAGGLMVKSLIRMQALDLGFRPGSVLSVRMTLPAPQYDRPRASRLFEQLLDRLAARGQFDGVAFASCAPLQGGCNGTVATMMDGASRGERRDVGVLWASPGYFDTLGVRVLQGRAFTAGDRAGQPKVVVINRTAARALWGDANPLGRRIGVGQGGFQDGAEVIGVVSDVQYGAIDEPARPDVYLPLLQSPRAFGVVFVRGAASAEALVSTIRLEVKALDPDLPLTDVRMLTERFDQATWRTRASAWLLGLFAGLGLVLAALGLYGVISQGVEQRTREIGVRMALGASRRDIQQLVVGRVCAIAAAGVVLGVLLSLPAMRLLTTLLFEVSARDPVVFAGVAGVLFAVSIAAGYLPARRAARVDPLVTLRAE